MTAAKLYKNNHQKVYRYAYSILLDKTLAEDITAQTFVVALQKFEQTKDFPTHSTWLIQIARNLMGNYFQKKKSVTTSEVEAKLPPGLNLEELIPSQIDLEKEAITEELNSDLQEALQQLDPVKREIVILKIWQEYSFKEIAEITKMKPRTVEIYYYRALKKLKSILEQKGHKPQLAVVILAFNQIKELTRFSLDSNKAKMLFDTIMKNSKELATGATAGASGLGAAAAGKTATAAVSSKVITSIAIGGVAIATATSVGLGSYFYHQEKNKEKNENQVVVTQPTPEITSSPTPTSTPSPTEESATPTATLDPTADWQTSKIVYYPKGGDSIYVKHPDNLKVTKDINKTDDETFNVEMKLKGSDYTMSILYIQPVGFTENYPIKDAIDPKDLDHITGKSFYRAGRKERNKYFYRYVDLITEPSECEPDPAPCSMGMFIYFMWVEVDMPDTLSKNERLEILQITDEIARHIELK